MKSQKENKDEISVTQYKLARNSLRDYWKTVKKAPKTDISLSSIKKDDYILKIKDINESIIKNVNQWFLVNIISPEIQENEKRKRRHKTILLCFLILFLIIQFGFLGYLIYWTFSNIIEFHKTRISFNDSTLKIIFTFISGYITSVVIELIAILKYIVRNVFDTSVSGLANAFKENHEIDNTQKEQESE